MKRLEINLEIDIELKFYEKAWELYSCLALKFKHQGVKGAPDRIIFLPNGHIFFIEFKLDYNETSPHQDEFIKMMKEHFNINTYVCFSYKEAITALEKEIKEYG